MDEKIRERFAERFVNEFDFAASHIEAYNVFVSETILIIVADTPEIAQLRRSTNEIHVVALHNPRMGRPTFINPDTGLPELLMPQQARLRNMSYAAPLYVDISYSRHTTTPKAPSSVRSAEVTKWFGAESAVVQERIELFEETYGALISGEMHRPQILAHLPVMVGSVICNSNGCGTGEEIAKCELPAVFIVGGSNRIISPISRLCWNHDFVFRKPKKKFAAEAETRSCHDSRMHRSTATLKLQYTHPNSKMPMNGRQILVDIPFLAKKIQLSVVFLALGWSLSSIPFVIRTAAGRHWYPEFDGMMKALILSCKISTEEEALLVIAQSSRKSKATSSYVDVLDAKETSAPYTVSDQIRYARTTLRRELLPHVGLTSEANTEKGLYLGVLVWKLFMCATNRLPPDDRDDYGYKRFDSAAVLMANLLRQVLGVHMRQRKQVIAKIFEKEERSGKEKRPISIPTVFTDSQITMRFASCFGSGKWTASKGGCVRTGVARCPSHVNRVAAVCEISRLSSPLKPDGKHVNARLITVSQYGRVDPSETPEGRSCGLVMYTCMGARLSVGASPRPLIALVEAYGSDFGFIPIKKWGEILEASKSVSCFDDLTRLRIDGIPMGWIKSPKVFELWLRELRRTGCMDDDVSVFHDTKVQEVIVRQDAGRLLRPLYLADKMYLLRNLDWTTLSLDELVHQGAIEYVDGLEGKSFAIAFDYADMKARQSRGTIITHMELDGSFQFGLSTSLIPAPQCNQSPRNTYQTAMCKQAVACDPWHLGIHRSKHELHYPQRPFVSTKTGKIDNYAYQASGSNACVALLSDPLNQEDALLMRKSYADRGAFTSSNCRLYKEHQRKFGSSANREVFQKPDPLTCGGRKDANYNKVQEHNGIVALNTYVIPNDVVIAKLTPVRPLTTQKQQAAKEGKSSQQPSPSTPSTTTTTTTGALKHRDACVLARGEPGYVSESISTTNAHGLGIRKVEVAAEREPVIGDKFSSRHGQKGTVGAMVADEDMIYTRDGTMPDIVINPNCIASRMTISQLIESLTSKASAASGIDLSDATAFKPVDLAYVRQLLIDNGFSATGNEVYYNPITGEPHQAEIFSGFVFYQRLRHMVVDKMHARGPTGPVETVTRQALEGRGRDGGQRFGVPPFLSSPLCFFVLMCFVVWVGNGERCGGGTRCCPHVARTAVHILRSVVGAYLREMWFFGLQPWQDRRSVVHALRNRRTCPSGGWMLRVSRLGKRTRLVRITCSIRTGRPCSRK